jgi:hypothetical protein
VRRFPRLALPLLGLAWLAAMVAGYYVVHKPFTGEVLIGAGRTLLSLLAAAAMVTLGGALGTRLLRDLSPLSRAEALALRALVGLGGLGLIVLALGLAGLLPPRWLAWLLTGAALALLWRNALAWGGDLAQMAGRLWSDWPTGGFERAVRAAVLLLLGMALLMALAPPTAWDALTYHLAGPAFYLRGGRIVAAPENHFLGFPQGVEMLYLWLIRLAGLSAAAPLHFAFGTLSLALLIGLAGRLGRREVGWLAALILLVSDSLWLEFTWPYVDLALMAYTLAAFVALTVWQESGERWLYLAGVLTGLALGVKYTAVGVAIGSGVLTLWLARERGLWPTLWAGARFTAIALLVFAPWAVKNALLDGDPFSPFGFGTDEFDALDHWYYLRPGTGLPLPKLLVAPVYAAIMGHEAGAPFGSSTGALLVAALPLFLVGWRERSDSQRRFVRHALIFTLPAYLVWLAGLAVSGALAQTRLLFLIFPPLALIGALGLDGLPGKGDLPLDVRWLARGLVGLVLALAVVNAGLLAVRRTSLKVLVGLEPSEDYLTSRLGWYYAAMQQINELPGEPRVLFLWEPRTLYCEGRCVPDSLINRWWHDRQLEPDPRKIVGIWRQEGATHVLVFEKGWRFLIEETLYEPLTAEDVAALDSLRGEVLIPIWDGGGAYTLYAIPPGEP